MRMFLFGATSLVLAPVVCAQDLEEGWITDAALDAAIVLGAGLENDPDNLDSDPALFEIGVDISTERTFQSGLTWGGRLVWRGQQDHRQRPAGGGGVAAGLSALSDIGAFSGLSDTVRADDGGPRGSLEAAYIFVEGGYGEVSLGRDTGIGARFFEGDVSVLSATRLNRPVLDASGVSLLSTRNDLTGPSLKVSGTTPRILGVRAGASFTPDADAAGLDRAPASGPDMTNIVEIGLNGSRRLRESGVRIRGGLTYAQGELARDPGAPARKDFVDVWSAGAEIESGDTRFGVTWLASNEGIAGEDYSAWTMGVAHDWDAWSASLTYGRATAEVADWESADISLEAQRSLSDTVDVGLAYVSRDLQRLGASSPDLTDRIDSNGVVVEITLRLEN
ncbi:MAG: porin [Pseudomonadota bacterium]